MSEFEKYYVCLNCKDKVKCVPNNYDNMLKIQSFLQIHVKCSMVALLTETQIKERSYFKTLKGMIK